MALTESKRRANNKYIAEHMTVVGCKLTKERASEFRLACKLGGTTQNAVLRAAVDDYIEQIKGKRTEE